MLAHTLTESLVIKALKVFLLLVRSLTVLILKMKDGFNVHTIYILFEKWKKSKKKRKKLWFAEMDGVCEQTPLFTIIDENFIFNLVISKFARVAFSHHENKVKMVDEL